MPSDASIPSRLLRAAKSFLAAGLASGVLAGGGATAAPPPKLQEAVEQAVTKLGAATRRERLEAERALLEIGPAALPLLPPPDLIRDPAARDAVQRIRIQLERRAALESVEASRVTWIGQASLAEILKEVSLQTGNAVRFDALPTAEGERLEVEFRDVPFWDVMAELAKRTGFTITADAERGELVLAPGEETSPPLAVQTRGSFRAAVMAVTPRQNFINPETRGLLRVQLRITAEPRLRPLFLRYAEADMHVEAEIALPPRPAGTSRLDGGDERVEVEIALPPLVRDAQHDLPLTDRSSAAITLDRTYPAGTELKSIALRGEVSIRTAANPEEIHFPDLEAGAPIARRRGGVTVTLQEAKFSSEAGAQRAEFRIAVAYDSGGPEFESHRTWMYHNDVWLQTPSGARQAVNDGFEVARQADGGAIVTYRFQNLDADAAGGRLIYVAPTLIVDVPVSLEFRDLPVRSAATR